MARKLSIVLNYFSFRHYKTEFSLNTYAWKRTAKVSPAPWIRWLFPGRVIINRFRTFINSYNSKKRRFISNSLPVFLPAESKHSSPMAGTGLWRGDSTSSLAVNYNTYSRRKVPQSANISELTKGDGSRISDATSNSDLSDRSDTQRLFSAASSDSDR